MFRQTRKHAKIALVTLALAAEFFIMTPASGTEITGLDGSAGALAFSPDGKILAVADGGYDLSLWDTGTGKLKRKLTGLATGTGRVCWAPDGKIVYGTSGNEWIAWDVATGKEHSKVKAEMTRTAPSAIALSKDGKTLAAIGRGVIKFWNTGTAASLGEYEAHPNYAINSVSFSPDGRFVVTTCNDRTAQLTESAGGAAGTTFKCDGRPTAAEFSPDGKTLFVADQTPSLHQFAVNGGADQPAPPMSRAAKQIAVSPDGRLVACAASSMELWSTTEKRWRQKRPENSAGTTAVAFSPDGELLACADMEGRIHFWSVKDLLSTN
jgi:WD40 repeat protein